jgi:folate-binding protein YgfZ
LPSPADPAYRALTESAALLDLSDRGRLCLLGGDREKFLHGQVTNDILRLRAGQGTYAALVAAKGRIESDLFVYKLAEELLLDFEPGLAAKITGRLEKYIIAEDVQIVDVSAAYSLLSIQGPSSERIVQEAGLPVPPGEPFAWAASKLAEGDLYIARNGRFGPPGFDLFVPAEAASATAASLEKLGAPRASREAAEPLRIENAIPRFGADMDESNLAPETGIQERAISYAKGCYIGQEVIARIRTYGQVAKALRLLKFPAASAPPPAGAKVLADGKEVGATTSSAFSPKFGAPVALAYVRKEANAVGTRLSLASGEAAEIVAAP